MSTNPTQPKLIPVYTTNGDAEAFLSYPYVFNRNGDWVGFITPQRDVYSVIGYYVGTITNDPRIVRKRAIEITMPRLKPPPPPEKIYLPATIPLAPLMGDLSQSMIDVLLEEPERLHTADSGEYRDDLD